MCQRPKWGVSSSHPTSTDSLILIPPLRPLSMSPRVSTDQLLGNTEIAQSHVSYMVVMAWVSNSIPGSSSKRAVALALVTMFATLGYTGGSWVLRSVHDSSDGSTCNCSYLWPAEWGPSYSKSFICCILAFSISLVMLFVYRRHLVRLNQEAEMREHSLGLPKGFRYIT